MNIRTGMGYHQRDSQAKLSDLLKQTKLKEVTRGTERLLSSLVRL